MKKLIGYLTFAAIMTYFANDMMASTAQDIEKATTARHTLLANI